MSDSPNTLPITPLLSFLDENDRTLLASYGEFVSYKQGDHLIEEGGEQDYLYIVVAGLAHVSRNEDGREMLIASLGPGELLGEVNVFDPSSASATITAIQPTVAWRMNRTMLEQFISDYPETGMKLLIAIATLLSRRLRLTSSQLADKQRVIALFGQAAEPASR